MYHRKPIENPVQILQQRHQNDANDIRSGVFAVNFEHIAHIVLVFLLFNLTR